jgi:DNA-binding beta-propeller fold protein YncE
LVRRVWTIIPASALAAAAVCGGSGCDRDVSDSEVAGPQPLKTIAVHGEVGTSPGQFVYPRCLDVDSGGSLWVIDKSARVQRIDPGTGRATALWTMPDHAQGKPCGITLGPPPAGVSKAEAVYIADTHYHRVQVYSMPAAVGVAPELLASFGSYGEGDGQFIYLTDVAILPSADGRHAERIYVSEYGDNDRVSVFDGSTKFLFSFGEFGGGAGPGAEFNRPQSLAIDSQRRELYVADACNHRIGVFDLDGGLKRWIGSPETAGPGPEQICYPYGIALLGDGTALVSEYGNSRVRHLDLSTGERLDLMGQPGNGKGQLATPWAVAIMGRTGYILDSGNARIQSFPAPAKRRRVSQMQIPGVNG